MKYLPAQRGSMLVPYGSTLRLTIDESTKHTEGHVQTIPHYDQYAEQLVSQYESLTFEHVHPTLLDLLPSPGTTILDVGAGSGRDAAWFAAKGYDVVAAASVRLPTETSARTAHSLFINANAQSRGNR